MTRYRRLLILAAVGAISVAGVACGGDGGAVEQDQQPADGGENGGENGGDDGGGLDY